MQVIQTVNDTIRVLFNPVVEGFRLLDFVLVEDANTKFLAQIIEIYDDKYDASQNVARLKLFYRVDENGGIFDYDHYTPSKECEIKKIKKNEIVTFVNEGKKAITVGLDAMTEAPFDINLDFFKNKATIFADKIDQASLFSAHLAHAFVRFNETSVIIDYTGTMEIENAKKLVATEDFKLPLDFYTTEYIWNKGLSFASLETQAVCREVLNEVQDLAQEAQSGFIPFSKFLRVIEQQQKTSPIVEFAVLLNNLKAYQKNNIFAQYKKEFESLSRAISDNEVVIVDFSKLKTEWHKEFTEYIVRSINIPAFLFVRLNDSNSDVDLINYIYDRKPEISFIPSVSYDYKKLPHITERTKNYILLPTLSPRRDFGHGNFIINSLPNDAAVLFGENTENFIFTIKNNRFEVAVDKKPVARKKIRLSLSNIKEGQGFEMQPVSENSPQSEMTDVELDFFEQLENSPMSEEKKENIEQKEDEKTNWEELLLEEEKKFEKQDELLEKDDAKEPEIEPETEQEEVVQEEAAEEKTADSEVEFEDVETKVVFEESDSEVSSEIEDENEANKAQDDVIEAQVEEIQPKVDVIEEKTTKPDTVASELNEVEDKVSPEIQEKISNRFENILDGVEDDDDDDDISLSDLAQKSIEATFDEVIDEQKEEKQPKVPKDNAKTLVVDEDIELDIDELKSGVKKEGELPVFKDEDRQKPMHEFKSGDIVEHEKYGEGEVIKVINYADRSLLQINFKEVGKRLLDPSIAKIKAIG